MARWNRSGVTLALIMVACVQLAYAQNRYMVFFTDKAGNGYSADNPSAFLSERSLNRRAHAHVTVTSEDLPVSESYLEVIRNLGIRVLHPTKWMNGVLVECQQADIATLEAQSFVSRTEYVAPGASPAGRISANTSKFSTPSTTRAGALSDTQLSMIGLDQLHAAGYRGEGILVAIMDAGFPGGDTNPFMQHLFDDNRVLVSSCYDYTTHSRNVFSQSNHGAHVWSIMAGYQADTFVGGAYKASYVLFVTEHAPTEYRVEEYNWLFAAERADSLGVDVINTSLGYTTFDDASMDYTQSQMDGETSVIVRASSMAASKGMAVIVSAGNEGSSAWHTIGTPADGKQVLAIGAVTVDRVRSSFSSFGPSADQRVKPDVSALGTGVSLITPSGTLSFGNGTSYSGPLVASLAAVLWQKFPSLQSTQLLDTLRAISSQYTNPDYELGYGIPNGASVITDVEPGHQQLGTHVYPNPFANRFLIRIDQSVQAPVAVQLVDARGQAVRGQVYVTPHEEGIEVVTHDLKPGMYLIQITAGRQRSLHKIIKSE